MGYIRGFVDSWITDPATLKALNDAGLEKARGVAPRTVNALGTITEYTLSSAMPIIDRVDAGVDTTLAVAKDKAQRYPWVVEKLSTAKGALQKQYLAQQFSQGKAVVLQSKDRLVVKV